jgi:hypothetical protein
MVNRELKDDVVVLKIIKDIQHRSFSSEPVEGWRTLITKKLKQ